MPVYTDGTFLFFMGAKLGLRLEGIEDQWLWGVWFCGGSVTSLEKDT